MKAPDDWMAMVSKCCVSPSREGFGLASAALAHLLIFAASAVPTLFYAGYKTAIGLTDSSISIAMVAYLLGVLGVLFFAGRLSDALGRKPLAALAVILAALGCFICCFVTNVGVLYVARFFQGLSCGLSMSAVSSWIVDLSRTRFPIVGTTLASTGPLIGLTVGSIAVGIIGIVSSEPNASYLATVALLGACLALIPFAPETVTEKAPLKASFKPNLRIEPSIRGIFFISAFAYTTAWCTGAYYQTYCSPLASDTFGYSAPIAASIVLALSMAPSAFGGPVEARLRSGFSLRVAMAVLLATVVASLAAMLFGAFAAFLAVIAAVSVAMGMALSGSMRLLLAAADSKSTATLVSVLNLVAYAACTVLSFTNGAIAPFVGLNGILLLTIAFVAISTCFVFLRTR